MYTGTVVWFNSGRGYGFVKRDNDGQEFFVHFSALDMDGYKKLDQGDEVEFDVEEGPKNKPQCCNVHVLRRAVGR